LCSNCSNCWRSRRDQDTDPGFHLPAPSQLPTWLPYAAGLVALAVLLLLVAQACGSDDAEPVAGTSAASKAADGEAGVEVDPADYLGRPVAQARAELEGLGLRVTVDRTVGGGEVGTVKAIAPTGSVPPGGQVALEAVAAPPPQDGDEGGDEDNGKGKGKGKNEDKGRGNDSGDEGDD
jgi:serine/threonine-protein kinase